MSAYSANAFKNKEDTTTRWDGGLPYHPDFLGKGVGERVKLVSLCSTGMHLAGFNGQKKIKFVDLGASDGWMTAELFGNKIVHPDSFGIIYDSEKAMLECALGRFKNNNNVFVASPDDPLRSLFSCIDRENGADLVIMSMVQVCQINEAAVGKLFQEAASCLKEDGYILMIDQSPWSRGMDFQHYGTRFKNKGDDEMTVNAPLSTWVEGVKDKNGDLIELKDYHRPLPTIVREMVRNSLIPEYLLTMDDSGLIKSSYLPDFGNGNRVWVPEPGPENSFSFNVFDLARAEMVNHRNLDQKVDLHTRPSYVAIPAYLRPQGFKSGRRQACRHH